MSIRKTIIKSALPYEVNKDSYLKPGSAVTKSHKEDLLFDHMFEIVLSQDYEDHINFRKLENELKARKEREQYEVEEMHKRLRRSRLSSACKSTNHTRARPSPSKLSTSFRGTPFTQT